MFFFICSLILIGYLGWQYRYKMLLLINSLFHRFTNITTAECDDSLGAMKIPYFKNETKYCIISPIVLGLRPILKIISLTTINTGGNPSVTTCDNINEIEEDVTEYLREYMGPFGNFHGVSTTPNMLGYQTLKVMYRNRSSKIYKNNEMILVKLPVEEHFFSKNNVIPDDGGT
jgi:hypothetical protein